MNNKYLIVIEKGDSNYSAFSPDVPGCAATGASVEETLENMRSALEFHFEGVVEEGGDVPEPMSLGYYIRETDDISNDEILAHVEYRFQKWRWCSKSS